MAVDEPRGDDPAADVARVLVVEDDPDVRLLLRDVLGAHGWKVDEAATAAAAFELVDRTDPDVVLLDLCLPGDGREVLGRLKASPATAWIPVVVVSAGSRRENASSLLLAGAQDYVTKPFDVEELRARLNAARRVAVEHRRLAAERERLVATQYQLESRLLEAQDLRRELQLLADTANDVIVRTSLERTIVYISPSAGTLLGWDPAGVVGTYARDWIHPDDIPALVATDAEVLSIGDSFRVEFRLRHQDGHWIWCESNGSVIQDPTTGRVEIRHSVRDISRRRAVEDALQASETKYRALVDLAAEGIWQLEPDGTIAFANPAMAAMLETTPEDLVGRSITEFMDEATAARAVELLARRRDGLTESFDSHLFTVTGRQIWISVTSSPIHGVDGTYRGCVAFACDVTARRSAEHALAESEAKYRTLVNLAAEGIWTLDAEGTITFANGTMGDMLGLSADELVGRPVSQFLDERGRALAAVHLARRRTGITEAVENRLLHVSGREVWVRISATPQFADDGTYRGVVAVLSDITALKHQEQATRAAEHRYRSAFEAAPVGMAQVGLDGRFVQANDALCELLGYRRDQLRGRTVVDVSHPDDAAGAARAVAALADGRVRSYHAEQRYLHADGHAVWVAVSAVGIRDDEDRPAYLLVHYLDVGDRKRFERELQHLVDHDPLTGLLNRRGFEVELDRQAARVARYGPSGALLVLDLDHFKQVNDTLGHSAGDELIVAIADVIRKSVRGTDVVARLGGDEFAVILPFASVDEAQIVADKLVRAVYEQATVLGGVHTRRVTTSIGIAPFDSPGLTGEDVLVNADLSMYDAKDAGRACHVTYTGGHDQPATKSRLAWVDRINQALDEGRFTLFAQPILDLSTDAVDRYELLVRMTSPDGDVVPPGAFLHVAERVGLVERIDRWVCEQAVGLLADPRLGPDVTLEVNLSGRSLSSGDVLDDIEAAIRSGRIDPTRLVLEVTETAAVANVHVAREFAERLTGMGCQFALDDFGAGFGSFYYLKHLPFDYLKIDGEFVAQCLSTPTDRLVIGAVVDIARGLHKKTVAEFVGDEATLRFLQHSGVDYAQGYYIGRPRPVAGLLERSTPTPTPTSARAAGR